MIIKKYPQVDISNFIYGEAYHALKENYTGIKIFYDTTYYFLKGLLHREDGPAIDRNADEEYWLSGKPYTIKDFWHIQKNTRHRNKLMAYFLGKNY
jgi:hypothetical protein